MNVANSGKYNWNKHQKLGSGTCEMEEMKEAIHLIQSTHYQNPKRAVKEKHKDGKHLTTFIIALL